ncbi:elongation factor 1-beta [Candidatus Woesearchaeota archaeon]|nr:elongation factor 1-beta [Candidatus Woesearchaeota archaeon]
MAQIIITLKIMPSSPEVNLEQIKTHATQLVSDFGGEVGKSETQPFAFGLNVLFLYFVMDESKGATDELEKKISELEGVESVEISDVRRAIG